MWTRRRSDFIAVRLTRTQVPTSVYYAYRSKFDLNRKKKKKNNGRPPTESRDEIARRCMRTDCGMNKNIYIKTTAAAVIVAINNKQQQ